MYVTQLLHVMTLGDKQQMSIRAMELRNLNIEYCQKPRNIGIFKSEY